METLGEKLKSTRLEKGLTIDQVSRETNITARYIEALESENFSVFPGEPYVIGFIRNYSSYLDLDVQKTIGLYRTLRIQEQPVPVEQLLKHPPRIPAFLLPVLAIIVVVGLSGWGIYSLVVNRRQNAAARALEVRAPLEYMMEGNSMEKRFYRNDAVLIPIDNDMYKLELTNLGETITIRTPGGNIILDLSQEANIDLNNDGIPELRITLADFAKNNADMGALLHFFMMDSIFLSDTIADEEQAAPYTPPTVSSVSQIIIPASVSAYPFTLQSFAQSYCMFRWEVLNERDRRDKPQHYLQRGDERSIQAQNGIRIWISNAQAARFQVVGGGRTYPVEVGSAGEVVVADIRWVRDDNNQYRLVLIRLETGT